MKKDVTDHDPKPDDVPNQEPEPVHAVEQRHERLYFIGDCAGEPGQPHPGAVLGA